MATTLQERFWKKVVKGGPDDCWLWTAAKTSNGYGLFTNADSRLVVAHRWLYEQLYGPLPPLSVVHHRCHNRACVNPAHLETLTNRANVLEGSGPSAANVLKTHCPQGHPYSGDNLYVSPRGQRICRQCRRDSDLRRRDPNRKPPNYERTHCPHGHSYSGDNLYVAPDGRRNCRQCQRDKAKRYACERGRYKGKGLPGERTHCPQGHAYEGDNLIITAKGRRCRTCKLEQQRQRRAAKQRG